MRDLLEKADIIPNNKNINKTEEVYLNITKDTINNLNKLKNHRNSEKILDIDINLYRNLLNDKLMQGGNYTGYCDGQPSQCSAGSLDSCSQSGGYLIMENNLNYYIQNGSSLNDTQFNDLLNRFNVKIDKKNIDALRQIIENDVVNQVQTFKNKNEIVTKQDNGDIVNDIINLKSDYQKQLKRLNSKTYQLNSNKQVGGDVSNLNNEIKTTRETILKNITSLDILERNLTNVTSNNNIITKQNGGNWLLITDPKTNIKHPINSKIGGYILNTYIANLK